MHDVVYLRIDVVEIRMSSITCAQEFICRPIVYTGSRLTDLEHSMEETLSTRLHDVSTPQ